MEFPPGASLDSKDLIAGAAQTTISGRSKGAPIGLRVMPKRHTTPEE
ncbi:hypothetical protein [Bradyrhizobium sp. STM 3562]